MAAGNYPWNRANPVPVIPDLWRFKPTADDNPSKAEPSPAKATPDPIRPQQSCAGASPGIPKLTMAEIVSRSIAGIAPDVLARGPTVPSRGSIRATPAPVDIYCGGPIPTGGVPVGPPRPSHPAPPQPGTVRFSPALADLTRTVPPPPLEGRDLRETWASNLVSPTAPQSNPLHSGPTDLPANQLAIVTRNAVPQAPPPPLTG